ncbi:MAG: hypothetical protein ACI8X5_000573 [Planctomycetota bacterium]|jgi:hypothetical protein
MKTKETRPRTRQEACKSDKLAGGLVIALAAGIGFGRNHPIFENKSGPQKY